MTPITLLTTASKVPKTAMSLKQREPATKIVGRDKGDQGQHSPNATANPLIWTCYWHWEA